MFRLSALSDDAQAVVVKVFEAVGAALDEFHFSMEALCDAVVFGEAPHSSDFVLPVGEGFGECGKRGEATGGELSSELDESRSESSALSGVLMFLT